MTSIDHASAHPASLIPSTSLLHGVIRDAHSAAAAGVDDGRAITALPETL